MHPASTLEESLHIGKIKSLSYTLELDDLDAFFTSQDGILGGIGADAPDILVRPEDIPYGVIFRHGQFFGDGRSAGDGILDPDMSPDAEDFLADGILESLCKSQGQQHCRDTDGGGRDSQPD